MYTKMNILNFLEFIKESKDWSNAVTAVIALFNKEGQLLLLKRGMTAPWKPGYCNITELSFIKLPFPL